MQNQMHQQHADTGQKILKRQEDEIRIQVPNYRLLPSTERPLQPRSTAVEADYSAKGETAYIRLRGQTQDEIENMVDYDLDSEDEQWLNKRNAKVKPI